ncbi:MAG: hypothetical protein KH111_01100 [Bacteroidales bacterium]|nr:hypothetical protein [Bacteroidales bacterium]
MKMKNIIIGCACGMLLSLVGCFHETELSESKQDRNWYILEDSDDELDHLRYLVFEQYKVPIFYKDTIGSRVDGKDVYGDPVVYYEVLDPNYDLVSVNDEIEIELAEKREQIITAVYFMKDEVLPMLNFTELLPRCFLLVESVHAACYSVSGNYRHEVNTYRSLMASLVGKVDRLERMSDEERKRFAVEIAAEEWASYLTQFKKEELLPFYTISESEVYSKSTAYSKYSSNSGPASTSIPYKDYREYGFLDYDHWEAYKEGDTYKTLNKQYDVADYVAEVLLDDDEAFEAKYAKYKWVLQKYELMKEIVETVKSELKGSN